MLQTFTYSIGLSACAAPARRIQLGARPRILKLHATMRSPLRFAALRPAAATTTATGHSVIALTAARRDVRAVFRFVAGHARDDPPSSPDRGARAKRVRFQCATRRAALKNSRATRLPKAAANARRESPRAPICASAITIRLLRTLSRRLCEKNFSAPGIAASRSFARCVAAKIFLVAHARRSSSRELRQRENPCAMRISS